MKKLKVLFAVLFFMLFVGYGFIQVNILNTSFYNYNKNKLKEDEFKELIKEFDGEFKGHLTDESNVKIYENDEEDLVADIGKYEMTIIDSEFKKWFLGIIENIKQGVTRIVMNLFNNAFS